MCRPMAGWGWKGWCAKPPPRWSPWPVADGIGISIQARPGLPPVIGERDELIQLFQNLIHNAIKYGREGGHVWITVDMAEPRRTRFSVSVQR